MPPYLSSNGIEPLILRYHANGIIVDTNLLLLLLFGLIDSMNLKRFKCVAKYEESDFKSVYKLVSCFSPIVVTPQILAELTNLVKVSEAEEKKLLLSVTSLLKNAREKYFAKNILIDEPSFVKLGFTDVTILRAARKRRLLVITEDLQLTLALRRESCDVLNLNDIRTQQWLNS